MVCNLVIAGDINYGLLDSLKSAYNPDCESVHVVINTNGGSLDEALAITEWLQSLGKPVKTEAIKAYSAGSVIFMGEGFERVFADNAVAEPVMIHRPTFYGLTAEELEEATTIIKDLESQMIDVYVSAGMDKEEAAKLVADETYFNRTLAEKYKVLAIKTNPKSTVSMDAIEELKASFKAGMDEVKALFKSQVKAELMPDKEDMPEKSPLEIEIDDLKTKLDAMTKERDMYKAECETYKGEAAKTTEAVAAVEARYNDLKAKIDKLEEVKADVTAKIQNKTTDKFAALDAAIMRGAKR